MDVVSSTTLVSFHLVYHLTDNPYSAHQLCNHHGKGVAVEQVDSLAFRPAGGVEGTEFDVGALAAAS